MYILTWYQTRELAEYYLCIKKIYVETPARVFYHAWRRLGKPGYALAALQNKMIPKEMQLLGGVSACQRSSLTTIQSKNTGANSNGS